MKMKYDKYGFICITCVPLFFVDEDLALNITFLCYYKTETLAYLVNVLVSEENSFNKSNTRSSAVNIALDKLACF